MNSVFFGGKHVSPYLALQAPRVILAKITKKIGLLIQLVNITKIGPGFKMKEEVCPKYLPVAFGLMPKF